MSDAEQVATAQRDVLKSWIEETVDLRYGIEIDPYSEMIAPFQITEALSDIRQRLDRIEELLVRSVRAKAKLTRSHREVKDRLQQAWDEHVTSTSALKRPTLTQEYVTGKEKFAEANLATLELQREERKSLNLLSFAEESVEVIRQMHRGLDGIRQDLLSQVKALQLESHLER